MADTMFFHKTALTGGGAGALDLIDGNDRGDGEPLQEGDAAFVTYNGEFYFYLLDEDVGGAESAPALIVPDTNAGDKRWVQQSIPAVGYLAIADIDDTPVNNELDAPISSNWAYEHAADPDAHGAAYVLPTASAATLGGVKVGTRLSIDGAGVLSADDQSSEAYVLPTASPATLGGIKIGTRLSIDGSGVVSADDQAYVLPAASAATLGGVKIATAATLGAIKIGTRLSIDAGGVVSADDQAIDLASPDAIGGTTPNTIQGYNKEIFKTASADSPLTAAECAGTIVSNYGMTDADCIIDLPTAAEGLSFVCVLPAVRARYFRLRCPSAQADKIYLLGVAGNDDGYVGVASGYATGSAISLFTFKASDGGYDWFAIPIFGTWVAG